MFVTSCLQIDCRIAPAFCRVILSSGALREGAGNHHCPPGLQPESILRLFESERIFGLAAKWQGFRRVAWYQYDPAVINLSPIGYTRNRLQIKGLAIRCDYTSGIDDK